MKPQIVMSPTNGQLAIAIPLYSLVEDDAIAVGEGIVLAFSTEKPMAYAIDCEDVGAMLMNYDSAHRLLEFLGDL